MQNLHIEHPEDMILEGNLEVFDALYSTAHISQKIDGAPSIVYGIHPNNGRFFVGTKSVFNKVKNMVCYTVEDINEKYDKRTHASLIEVLTACLLYLPRNNEIIQADFIGFGGSNIYRPNTLTYSFPEIVKQKIIIAPHTEYNIPANADKFIFGRDPDLRDVISSPLLTTFADSEDVKYIQPTVDRVYEGKDVPSINTDRVTFLTPKETKIAKKAINNLIREGIELSDANLYDILGCNHLVNLYQIIIDIKNDLMDSFIVGDAPKCYNDGIEIKGEGFVMVTKYGIIKLVDREDFAYANFNKGRFQNKS